METVRKEFFGVTNRPAFLSAERNKGNTHYGIFSALSDYTSASTGKKISVVQFVEKDGRVWLIATFTLRIAQDAPTGENALGKPLQLRSVMLPTGMWVWEVDFIQ